MSVGPDPLIALKASVYQARFDGGVVFRGSETPVVLRGEKAHKLVAPVVAEMRRGTSRPGLLARLPEPVRPVVGRLLDDLDANGLLRRRAPNDPRTEETLAPRFRHLWEFLADNLDAPGEALRRWADQLFYVAGDATATVHAVRALAESAAVKFLLAPANGDAVRPGITALRAEFPDLDVIIAPAAPPPADAVVIYAAGDVEPDLAAAAGLTDAWFFGPIAGHLIVAKVAGPLAPALAGWSQRLRPPPASIAAARIPETRVALAAASAAFGLLCDLLQIGRAKTGQAMVFAARPGLRIAPVALPAPIAFRAADAALPETATLTDLERLERLQCLLDPVSGLLDPLDDVDQVPLSIARYRVRGAGVEDDGAEPVVTGWGLSYVRAQLDGIRQGLALFLSRQANIGAGAVGVGWTEAEARDDARRAAAARSVEHEAVWTPIADDRLRDPESLRLAKLIELLTGEAVEFEESSGCDGTSLVRLSKPAVLSATVVGSDRTDAIWRALGAACVHYQLGDEAGNPHAPGCGADAATGAPRWIDTGYPELEGVVFCCHLAGAALG